MIYVSYFLCDLLVVQTQCILYLFGCRYETEDIKDIMGWISLHLKYDAFPYITRDLVGIYSRMGELESILAIGSNNVRFIQIWGMGEWVRQLLLELFIIWFLKKLKLVVLLRMLGKNPKKMDYSFYNRNLFMIF